MKKFKEYFMTGMITLMILTFILCVSFGLWALMGVIFNILTIIIVNRGRIFLRNWKIYKGSKVKIVAIGHWVLPNKHIDIEEYYGIIKSIHMDNPNTLIYEFESGQTFSKRWCEWDDMYIEISKVSDEEYTVGILA
jgi:hypothetical protein